MIIIDEFVDSIIQNRPSILDAEDIVKSMRAVFACQASDKKGTACSYSAVGNALCAFRSMNIEDMADFEMELPGYMSAVTEDVKKRGR